MAPLDLRALIAAAGRAIARGAKGEDAVGRLDKIASREEFAAFVKAPSIRLDESQRRALLDAMKREDWRDTHAQLASTADRQLAEFRDGGG